MDTTRLRPSGHIMGHKDNIAHSTGYCIDIRFKADCATQVQVAIQLIHTFAVRLLIAGDAVEGSLRGFLLCIGIVGIRIDGDGFPVIVVCGIHIGQLDTVRTVRGLHKFFLKRARNDIAHAKHLNRLLDMVIDTAVSGTEANDLSVTDSGNVIVYGGQHFPDGIQFNVDLIVFLLAKIRPCLELVIEHILSRNSPHIILPCSCIGVLQVTALVQYIIAGPCRIIAGLLFVGFRCGIPDKHIGPCFEEFQRRCAAQLVRGQRLDADKRDIGIAEIIMDNGGQR